MEWEAAAVDEFIKLPLIDSVKANARIHAEKMARRNGSVRVAPADLEQTKIVYFAKVSEAIRRREYEKRVAAGETDLWQRIERAGRAILAAEGSLCEVDTCRAGYSFCPTQVFNLKGLKNEIEALLKRLNFTERLADKLPPDTMILAHHHFKLGLSGCVNGCAVPETKSFGVSGSARPCVTDKQCEQSFACVDTCKRGAIVIRDGGPVINRNLCDACGQCIKACPSGALATEEKGYKVFVGGRLGRFHQHGHELFKMADQALVLKALEATVETYLAGAAAEEHPSAFLNRVGLAPIYQRIYQDAA